LGQFSYKAVDRMGGRVTGVVDATDRRSAVTALAGRGHFATDLVEQGRDKRSALELPRLPSLGGRRVASKDVLAITTQLSTAVRAGLPLLHCLKLIGKQQHKPVVKELLENLVNSVSSGASLSEAMSERTGVFSPLYISMIRVGETGGILEQTSTQLAAMLNREETIKTNMKNASAYPIFVLAIGLISAVVIVTGILPRILATVDVGAAAMPLPTRILMGLSDFTRTLSGSEQVGPYDGQVIVGSLQAAHSRSRLGATDDRRGAFRPNARGSDAGGCDHS